MCCSSGRKKWYFWPRSSAVVNAGSKIVEHVVARPHRERDDGHGSGFVCAVWKNARVTDIEIRDIMRLCPLIGDVGFRIIAEAADSGFMQTGSRSIRFAVGPP